MLSPDRSAVIVNTHEEMPSDFIRDRDFAFPGKRLVASLQSGGAPGRRRDARRHASRVGAARRQHRRERADARVSRFSAGLLPVSGAALYRALELYGRNVEENKLAFDWGRFAAESPERGRAARDGRACSRSAASLPEAIARREEFLVGYQNRAYAAALSRAPGARGRRRAARAARQPGAG